MVRPNSNHLRDQFIELECTDSAGFSLENYRLMIADVVHFLIPVNGNHHVPYGYLIIHPSSYSFSTGRYENEIPLNTTRFQINETYFCGNGIPLSDTINVRIISTDNSILSQFSIRSYQRIGYSLERILTRISTSDSNWAWSQSIDGTPGRRNSVSPPLLDCAVISIEYAPLPLRNGLPYGNIVIRNLGEISASVPITILLKRSPNLPYQVFNYSFLQTVQPFQNYSFQFPLNAIDSLQGKLYLKTEHSLDDENVSNNTLVNVFNVWNTVVPTITEMMLYPILGQPKWLEFYWGSPNQANFGEWIIQIQNQEITIPIHQTNISANTRFIVSTGYLPPNMHLPPEQMIVVPEFNFNPSSNFFYRIISPWGEVIEEMDYRLSSFPILVYGKSVVRRSLSAPIDNPFNWYISTEQNGSAPGREDTPPDTFGFEPPIQVHSETIKIITKKFSRDGIGGLPSYATIEINTSGKEYEQMIYDLNGKLLKRELFQLSKGIHTLIWDGLDNQGKIVDCGVYLFILKSNNQIVFREPIIFAR
ncbi:MAG: hypothetical protein N2450_03730 [bacterium]|nr:hypothetical protein [bacterium]